MDESNYEEKFADLAKGLALMLIFWPVLLVSFTAMLVLAWVEKEPGDR